MTFQRSAKRGLLCYNQPPELHLYRKMEITLLSDGLSQGRSAVSQAELVMFVLSASFAVTTTFDTFVSYLMSASDLQHIHASSSLPFKMRLRKQVGSPPPPPLVCECVEEVGEEVLRRGEGGGGVMMERGPDNGLK